MVIRAGLARLAPRLVGFRYSTLADAPAMGKGTVLLSAKSWPMPLTRDCVSACLLLDRRPDAPGFKTLSARLAGMIRSSRAAHDGAVVITQARDLPTRPSSLTGGQLLDEAVEKLHLRGPCVLPARAPDEPGGSQHVDSRSGAGMAAIVDHPLLRSSTENVSLRM